MRGHILTQLYILGFTEIPPGVSEPKGVENRSSPLLWLVAFTTAVILSSTGLAVNF